LFFSEEEKNICVCNRPESLHNEKHSESKDTGWDMVQNTDEKINPAHGTLRNGASV
jgi:hypothetical protein